MKMKERKQQIKVKRDSSYFTKDTLVQHLRAIGTAIIRDAETNSEYLNSNCKSISILATIAPETEITTINYSIECFADPRISLKGEKQ